MGAMAVEIREELEQLEHRILSPRACFADSSRGRERPMEPCPLRTAFQRDRDRIVHCKSFRRLKHKTQVFLAPQGDHYRTRLTHTLEVSQIARTMARALRLNEDLTEAIALGHDLGHTPFGHMGERTLDSLNPAGFHHNEQSLRVVERLEGSGGLNLTWEVRDGIAHHSGQVRPATLEGRLVALADRIAYINHDIDDAERAGMLAARDLPAKCVEALGDTHGRRIDTLIRDVVRTSDGQDDIMMSERNYDFMMQLREFLFERIYRGDWAREEEKRADHVISDLYRYFMDNPVELPNVSTLYTEGFDRAICDYIAGMTDQYAVELFRQKFIPAPFLK